MELEVEGKRARACGDILAGDRLSALPDCMIHHIMSFMKARQVVQTCVLSTRWRHLWRSVRSLDIDEEEFRATGMDDDNSDDNEELDSKFEDFTDHLIIPNNISIALLDSFRLHVTRDRSSKQAAKWIRHGIKYSTQAPSILHNGLDSIPWCLKRLHLSNVQLDECFAKHISSGCQYLEDMELKDCTCRFKEIISHSLKNLMLKSCICSGISGIESSNLKNLVIDNCTSYYRLLIITAPAIEYMFLALSIDEFGVERVSFNEMPSLVKAHVQLRDNHEASDELSKNQAKLLGSLSNVTSLELSGFQTMMLSKESTTFPNFRNLKSLLLDSCDLSDNFKMLGHFLKDSPNLEKLTIRCCKFSKDLKRQKGKAKSKIALSSQGANLLDAECKNLKLMEIMYKEDDVRLLVDILLSISWYLPKNTIKLTRVD